MERTRTRKFTGLEWRWIFYDIGNSAITLLITTLLPIHFNTVAASAGIDDSVYISYWGYGTGVATAIVAVLGPILGSISDRPGAKKKLFILSIVVGVAGFAALALPQSWISFLVLLTVSRIGYQSSLIFYDAMLTDVTVDARMDDVSSYGYALGYIGSVIPFVASLAVVLAGPSFGLSAGTGMSIAIMINAVWWVAFTLPLLQKYRQTHSRPVGPDKVRGVFLSLWETLKEIWGYKKIFYFLLAFFFYIDGVHTIINMAVAYGTSLGLDQTMLLLALLLTQIVAFPAAIAFSIFARKYDNVKLITVAIIGYTAITLFAVQLDKVWEFWFLAVMVGLFQGGIQAMSRSYFAKLIPPEKAGEYFSIYDIFGKGATILGVTLVSVISHATGRQQIGIGAIVVIFIIGFVLFRKAAATPITERR